MVNVFEVLPGTVAYTTVVSPGAFKTWIEGIFLTT